MKNVLFLTALSLLFLLSSCKKDEVAMVNIEFEEPTPNQVVADASDVHIHIHFTSTDELHDIEIKMHPESDVSDLILDEDIHSHDEEYVFLKDLDLSSYPSGTEFHIEVEVCIDHDCEERETAEMEFSIQ